MIPLFPEFTYLTFGDKSAIEQFTRHYLPYSDFNFYSLWIWNTDKNTQVSLLNENLIILLKDYVDDFLDISFLGENNVQPTVEALLNFASIHKRMKVKLVPEVSIERDKSLFGKFSIVSDPDQCDYIYETKRLSTLEGPTYKKKRNLYRKFEEHVAPEMRILELSHEEERKKIQALVMRWKMLKEQQKKKYNIDEFIAIDRFLALSDFSPFLCLGLFHEGMLIGFAVGELCGNAYCILHLEKTIFSYAGISEFLLSNFSKLLVNKGYTYLNFEQDVGNPGLKKAKQLWYPTSFLKKYTISPNVSLREKV